MDGRSPDTLKCRFCRQPFPDTRKLAVHEERHKPVLGPKEGAASIPCSGRCGRYFLSWAEYREHAPLCDGLSPLPPVEDPEDEEPAVETIACPECHDDFSSPEKLSVHLVRHEEVKPATYDPRTGELMSRACPRSCGRYFLSKKDYKDHIRLCDGSEPLPPGKRQRKPEEPAEKKEGQVLKCEDCGRSFNRKAALGSHRFRAHGVRGNARPQKKAQTPSKSRRRVPEPPRAAGRVDGDVIELLKQRAQEHRDKADKLETMIQQLEEDSLL